MISAFQIDFSSELHDFNPKFAGEGAPTPGVYGSVSDGTNATIIHYIVQGSGQFYSRGQVFPVRAGQAFLICPNEKNTYISDPKDPWFYRWVGFTGALSYQFESLPAVLDLDEDPFPSLEYLQDPSKPLDYMLAGDLFHLYCKLLKPKNKKLAHIQQIINHIQKHYMDPLTVEGFAKQYGLDRRYLSRQFKKRTGYTIRSYITKVRLDSSRHYLMQGYSGKEVATMCGFTDTSNFYKIFKDRFGRNPSVWRKEQVQKTEDYHNQG